MEFDDLYSSPSIITIIKSRRVGFVGHVARMRKKGNGHRLITGKPEGNKPLARPRSKLMDIIRMDFGKMGWGGLNKIGLVQIGTG
jgi:hypothetical protein